MVASLLTCSGASVGVSISTQRRMPSRMVAESKASEEVVMCMWLPAVCISLPTSDTSRCHFRDAPVDDRWHAGWTILTLVGSFARGNLFDQFDDAASKLGVGNARERASQCE